MSYKIEITYPSGVVFSGQSYQPSMTWALMHAVEIEGIQGREIMEVPNKIVIEYIDGIKQRTDVE